MQLRYTASAARVHSFHVQHLAEPRILMLTEFFSLNGLMTLGMLILLQAVLGFDNLLYISLESKRVETKRAQQLVRWWGIGIAIVLRLILLAVLMVAIRYLKKPFFSIDSAVFQCELTFQSIITIFGGAFILYTAIKEIYHMLAIHEMHGVDSDSRNTKSFQAALFWIVLMNLVFSFDSILSAMALTENFLIMAVAVVISGVLMIVLADKVSEFLKKNRMYEILGLFILFLVGVMLISDGGHQSHIALFSYKVEPMAKSTFYFTLIILVIVDLVQSRYQKKLLAEQKAASDALAESRSKAQSI
jgi:predicted tellurium resistance membrane protein TerC